MLSLSLNRAACSSRLNLQCYVLSTMRVIPTTVPTLYTASQFDPNIDLLKCALQAKQLFAMTKKYTPPIDFNYKLPNNGRCEFAFVGRSNAGKSSIIASLFGRKDLLRISKHPGCTQNINFFAFCKGKKKDHVDDHAAYLVDLPGYGFAAKKTKKDQEEWNAMIMGYFGLRSTVVLRRVFVLIDSRRGVMDLDVDMMECLNTLQLPYQLVFTKSDMVNDSELQENLLHSFNVLSRMKTSTCFPYIHVTSSKTGSGIDKLKWALGGIYGNKNREVIEGVQVQ